MVNLDDNKIIADRTLQLVQGVLDDGLVLHKTFARYADENFKGRPGDPVFMRVQKPLGAREYSLYNDRAQPIQMDFLEETVVPLEVDKHTRIYSAVGMRGEVMDFDFQGEAGEVFVQQGNALVAQFENTARKLLTDAPFEFVKHVDYSTENIKAAAEIGQDFILNALLDAQAALKKMNSPLANVQTYAIAGSDWAAALRKNQRLNLALGNNNPDAFADATIGRYAGITIVEDSGIAPDELYLYTGEAFLAWSAAPGIPFGALKASQTTVDDVAMTWIQDYDQAHVMDRSVFSTYSAFGYTKDFISARDTAGHVVTSEDQFFIRGAKLVLGAGTDIEPGNSQGEGAGADPESFLAKVYKREAIEPAKDGTLVFADLTYQNVVDGNVAQGKAGELKTRDNIRTTRKRTAKAVNEEPATGEPTEDEAGV